jgi:hypothetical protein
MVPPDLGAGPLRCRLKWLLTLHRETGFATGLGKPHCGKVLTTPSGGEEGLHERATDVT